MYASKSTSLQIINRNKLEEVKLKNYDKVEDFFVEYEKACNELKSAGAKLTEEEKMRYLIKALPPSYSYIGDFIDLVPEDERTVEYVKAKIKEKNLSRSDCEKKPNVSTYAAKTKALCFLCGKPGHYKKDCWYNLQGNQGKGTEWKQRGSRGQQRGQGRSVPQRGFGRGRSFSHQGPSSSTQHGEQQTQHSSESWVTQMAKVNMNKLDISNSKNSNTIEWLLDSGCTDHIINNDNYFSSYTILETPVDVKLPDGKDLQATKIGTVKTFFENYNNNVKVNLENVYFVEGIKRNLLSFSKITDKNTIVARNHNAKIYNKNRKLVAVSDKLNGLYTMKSFLLSNEMNCNIHTNTVKLTTKEKWHRALGHINFQYLNKLVNEKIIEGLPEKLENNTMKCANCIKSKMTNVPFENNRSATSETLELIHTDLNGPHQTTGYGGEKYFLTFIDDYSKCAKVYCIKNKNETADCFIEFTNFVENKFNKRIKKLRCDNGREYLNKEIYNFIKHKGIELSPCPPYVHELNGVAERFNRSVMDMGRCLAREAKINLRYWPEVVKTAAYLKNRTIANNVERKTPYEILHGKRPNVKHLKIYGSKVFVRIPELRRRNKWDDKSKLGILVGYNDNSYRILVNGKVINARHVRVVEDDTELICLEETDHNFLNSISENEENENELSETELEQDNLDIEEHSSDTDRHEEIINNEVDRSQTENETESQVQQRSSKRIKKQVDRYGDPVLQNIQINFVNANVPQTFDEAINSPERSEWQQAMNREIESLKKNNTWIVVDKPRDKKIIDVKWFYK